MAKPTARRRKAPKPDRSAVWRAREPGHPGAILRVDVLPGLGVTISEAADGLRVSRQTLHRIMAEKASITPEMALRLGRYCGNGAEPWLRMQISYDLWHAEKRLKGELARIPTRHPPK